MAFRGVNITAHLVKFNSAASADFLDLYQDIVRTELTEKSERPKHRTFAPSQMRCDRVSWFRLRGTTPDKVKTPDMSLEFTAEIGTACHENIQKRLSFCLKDDWISVSDWINSNPDKFSDYQYSLNLLGYETRIDLVKPFPVRFACDGIFRFQDKVRLLEIKTAEMTTLQDLIEPKSKHIDQVTCYATLLKIPDVMFLYQERAYGEIKCFEFHVSESASENLVARMKNVMELAEVSIAPEGLPVGDPDCTPSMCPYYNTCKQWGR